MTEPSPTRSAMPRLLLSAAALLAVLFGGVVAVFHVAKRPRVITNATSPRAPNGRGGSPPMSGPIAPTGAAAGASLAERGWPMTLGGGAQYHRIYVGSATPVIARFTHEGQVLRGTGSSVITTDVATGSDAPAPREVTGRLLDVASTGELALLRADGTLVTLTAAGGAREVAKDVIAASYTSDASALAIVRREGEASVVEFPASTVIARGSFMDVRVSRDGQSVAVMEPGRVGILDRKGNQLAASSAVPEVGGIAWSPDGRDVWFTVGTRLHALGAGTQDRTLFEAMLPLSLQDVAVDGRLLVFARDVGDLFVIQPPRY